MLTYAECHTKAPYAECHYVKCRYVECRGVLFYRATTFVKTIVSTVALRIMTLSLTKLNRTATESLKEQTDNLECCNAAYQ
jgi:hypothetical protein